MTDSEIVDALGESLIKKIVTSVQLALEDMPGGLSGDDSGLCNVWEEYCAQVKFQHSTFWGTYVQTLEGFIAGEVEELKEFEKLAIWYQTDEGWMWHSSTEQEREEHRMDSMSDSAVIEFLSQKVESFAMDFESDTVESYLSRFYG